MALVEFEEVAPLIGKITLNDPDNLNAMSEEMAAEFNLLITTLKQRPEELRVLILTGAGRAFSAGGHLEMLEKKSTLTKEENRQRMLKFYSSFLGILSLGVPVIAALNGHAVGAGLCLATACDIRIAAKDAKLGFTFVKLGLFPGMGATYFLPRVIGTASARELMLTGRVIAADEAHRIGLTSKVVEREQLMPTVMQVAQEILSSGPSSVRLLLETLRGGSEALQAALDCEAAMQAESYASTEFKEGIRAAIEKRPARFSNWSVLTKSS